MSIFTNEILIILTYLNPQEGPATSHFQIQVKTPRAAVKHETNTNISR